MDFLKINFHRLYRSGNVDKLPPLICIKLPTVEMLINFHRLYRINVNKLPLLYVEVEFLKISLPTAVEFSNFLRLHCSGFKKNKLPLLISQWIF